MGECCDDNCCYIIYEPIKLHRHQKVEQSLLPGFHRWPVRHSWLHYRRLYPYHEAGQAGPRRAEREIIILFHTSSEGFIFELLITSIWPVLSPESMKFRNKGTNFGMVICDL